MDRSIYVSNKVGSLKEMRALVNMWDEIAANNGIEDVEPDFEFIDKDEVQLSAKLP